MREMKAVDDTINKHCARDHKKEEYRIKTIEEKKSKIRAHNDISDRRRLEVFNKDYLIKFDDYTTLIPKHRQANLAELELDGTPTKIFTGGSPKKGRKSPSIEKSSLQKTSEGIVVHQPDHLSNFVIDKPKIDFFKHAQSVTSKLLNSEKNRARLIKQNIKQIHTNTE